MNMEGKFLFKLINDIKDNVNLINMSEDDQDKWARKFIRQCVDNELALLNQTPCHTCNKPECTNCTTQTYIDTSW